MVCGELWDFIYKIFYGEKYTTNQLRHQYHIYCANLREQEAEALRIVSGKYSLTKKTLFVYNMAIQMHHLIGFYEAQRLQAANPDYVMPPVPVYKQTNPKVLEAQMDLADYNMFRFISKNIHGNDVILRITQDMQDPAYRARFEELWEADDFYGQDAYKMFYE